MQEFRQRMRKKVYRTFLLSFLLVFVLPAAALVGFMANMLGTVEKELETSNHLMLEQMKSGADGQLYAVTRIGDTLVADDKVLYFSTIADPMRYLNNITAFQTLRTLIQEMTSLQIANSSVSSSYLYFTRSQKVIANTVMTGQDYFQRRLTGEFLKYEDWLAYLGRGENGFVRRDNGALRNPLSYVRTIFRGDVPSVTIVITLDESVLRQFQQLVKEKQGMGFTILDARGQVLYSTLPEAAFAASVNVRAAKGDAQGVQSPQGKLRISYIRSADTGCVYVVSIPESVYWTRLNTIRQVSLLVVLVILAVGFFLSFAFAKRQYRPIHALRSFVEGISVPGQTEGGDDFAYLQEMMQSMKNSRLSINQRLKFSNQNMEHFVLESLMWGTYGSIKEVEDQLLALDIAYDSDSFVVAGFCADGFTDSAILPEDGEDDARLMRFVLRNVFSELLAGYNSRLTELHGWTYALLCLPASMDAWQEKLEETLINGRQILKDNFDLGLTVAVSFRVQGLHKISQAYGWVRDTLASRQPGADELLLYWKRESAKQPVERLTEEIEAVARRLEQLTAAGELEEAKQQIHLMKKAAVALPGWTVKLQCAVLLQGILQNLSLRIAHEDVESVSHHVQQYMEAPPAKDDFLELTSIVEEACALSAASNENLRRSDIARKADEYIQEHYAQSSMSISRVAEHLNLTASYASSLYKRQTGQAMLDTINMTRIHHAKLLLTGSHMSLEQVAEKVGYYNSSSFIRAFKKYESITPGQYRALKGKSGGETGIPG
jgi:two-component system, response regulator YesN